MLTDMKAALHNINSENKLINYHINFTPQSSSLASFSRYATMRKFGEASFFCVDALKSSA